MGQQFLVVGIGASAGGLDAMNALFDAMPGRLGMALLIVQHLDPKGESHLVDLLSRHTTLTVMPAEDGVEIRPDHVYVCVPNRDLVVNDGRLRLVEPRTERYQRRPIDRLFESLASAYGDRAVAVVLSGTASDGSRGISAIKAAGGMVIAQHPGTAAFDGMPRSAVMTGLVDLVLPIDEMPGVLQRLATPLRGGGAAGSASSTPRVEPATLESILDVLQRRFGYDFAEYKRATLLRRTQRRMSLRGVNDFDDYATLVRQDDNEATSLFRDLMISVSGFFRDPEAWQQLARDVLDPLIAAREGGEEIRVWSVGCATGEEPYTIAMLLDERSEAAGRQMKPRIFATDVSESIETARAGIYPETIASEISPERLDRFFTRHESTYRVKQHLRDMIVFARHNVISDPPFSRMDLVCCRNMLIYIEPETQRQILWLLNFSLHDGATLFLGGAETVGSQTDAFEPISEKWRIFRSRRMAHAARLGFPRYSLSGQRRAMFSSARHDRPATEGYLGMVQRELLHRYAPPSVLIDANQQVLVYHGDTSSFVTQPGGEPTRDLLALVAVGVRPALRHAIHQAVREEGPTVTASGYATGDLERQPITFTVSRIGPSSSGSPVLLVTFERPAAPTSTAGGPPSGSEDVLAIDELEESQALRHELRDVSEQYDRLVEEYGTSNEEMLSINEELQSANEELETSKEELQSLNEELNTLNNELRSKVEILEQTNNDLNNLMASTEIATIFLDSQCRIRWFTPAMTQVLRLISSDVGRPIRDLVSTVTGSGLEPDARRVLTSLIPIQTEVDGEHGRCFLRRVLPYRTADNRIDGVVITFVNITEHREAARQRERLMGELSHRIKNMLAMVEAIVHILVQRCDSLPDFIAAFEPRLGAMARAHSAVTTPGGEHLGLRKILDRELDPFLGGGVRRVTVEGNELPLGREHAIAMGMVLHELATNAVKHGALSTGAGTISVRLERIDREDGAVASFEWIERGGPRIESPGPRGFGSLLIESTVSHDLSGTVALDFKPDGLHCVIVFPIPSENADGINRWSEAGTGPGIVTD
jgi:two-component system CheB/CheR fusion protein